MPKTGMTIEQHEAYAAIVKAADPSLEILNSVPKGGRTGRALWRFHNEILKLRLAMEEELHTTHNGKMGVW